jgi:hypothetical protein
MLQRRQGDIFFQEVSGPKGNTKPYNNPIIAYGEVTGHAHKIMTPSMEEMDSVVDENGDIFIRSPNSPIHIGHEEHGAIDLPANTWVCITRQREYDPIAESRQRKVAD